MARTRVRLGLRIGVWGPADAVGIAPAAARRRRARPVLQECYAPMARGRPGALDRGAGSPAPEAAEPWTSGLERGKKSGLRRGTTPHRSPSLPLGPCPGVSFHRAPLCSSRANGPEPRRFFDEKSQVVIFLLDREIRNLRFLRRGQAGNAPHAAPPSSSRQPTAGAPTAPSPARQSPLRALLRLCPIPRRIHLLERTAAQLVVELTLDRTKPPLELVRGVRERGLGVYAEVPRQVAEAE